MENIYVEEKIQGPRRYQSFFTAAEEINGLMVSLLGDVENAKVLEPCAGHGAFVTPLLHRVARIDAIDVDINNVRELSSIDKATLHVQAGDFIHHFVGGPLTSPLKICADYDAIVCNPPYGLRFSVPYRKSIKSKFPGVYARESYGLFMMFGLQCLKEKGRFVFIVPDTFLTSRNHRHLRIFLRDNANLSHIVQFKSARFQSINFGYGDLCVIAGNRSASGQQKDVLWLDYRKTKKALNLDALSKGEPCSSFDLRQSTNNGWVPPCESAVLFSSSHKILGDIADCRTGIYTGDNTRFCAYDELQQPPRINGHPISWNQVRSTSALTAEEREKGLMEPPYYIPLFRGGHRAPYEETRSALTWSRDAVEHYRTDKKARLQNARYYFRKGLAIPMVTSGRLSASFMEGAVFDQGVVGVFPKEECWIEFLLVLLNSEYATKMKRSVNPGANNSANYIKRIKIPVPKENQLKRSKEICMKWRIKRTTDKRTVLAEATEFVAKHFLPT